MATATRDSNKHTHPSSSSVSTGFAPSFLFLSGLVVAAAGVFLIQPPSYLPHGEWIATKLLRAGVMPGSLLVGGFVAFCLGFVVNRQARFTNAVLGGSGSDVPESFDKIQGDLRKIRTAMGNVQAELLANQQRQDSMIQSIQGLRTEEPDDDQNANAMFRLAASLDQLGARIEERLKSQNSTLDSKLSEVTSALQSSQNDMSEGLDEVLNQILEISASVPEPSESTHIESSHQEPESFPETPQEFTPEQDDFGYEEPEASHDAEEMRVYVDLEEEQETHEAQTAESTLGILDEIDDFGMVREPEPTEPEPTPLRMADPNRMSPRDDWPPAA